MKVKIADNIYDGDKEPVMVILSDEDKKNITNMLPECSKYMSYPDNFFEDDAAAYEWMEN